MSRDRFINFEPGKLPEFDQVHEVCVQFIGGSGTVELKPSVIFVEIPGVSHSPMARPERFMEIYRHTNTNVVDVVTREGDAFINALADRLADIITHQFNGFRDYMGTFPENYANEADTMARYRWHKRHGAENRPYPGGPIAAYDTMLHEAEDVIERLTGIVESAPRHEIMIAKRRDDMFWLSSDDMGVPGTTIKRAIMKAAG